MINKGILGNKMIADKLKSEWFQYVGSNLTTTREFCLYLTKKRYIHKSEIPEILTGMIDGHQCKISEKTGLPIRMKKGTNPDNFIINRGGSGCGHELIPVDAAAVPKYLRAKVGEDIKYDKIDVVRNTTKILDCLYFLETTSDVWRSESSYNDLYTPIREQILYQQLDSTKYLLDALSAIKDYQEKHNRIISELHTEFIICPEDINTGSLLKKSIVRCIIENYKILPNVLSALKRKDSIKNKKDEFIKLCHWSERILEFNCKETDLQPVFTFIDNVIKLVEENNFNKNFV